jgi:glucan 1,3-beta-glucosidase
MRTFSLLPLGVLFVGFEAALRLGVSVEAKQQCRLQLNNNQVPSPIRTSPIIGTGTSATGYLPTATSLGSSTTLPSITPFNYGTDPIRGVNL